MFACNGVIAEVWTINIITS